MADRNVLKSPPHVAAPARAANMRLQSRIAIDRNSMLLLDGSGFKVRTIEKLGSPGRIRTSDQPVNSRNEAHFSPFLPVAPYCIRRPFFLRYLFQRLSSFVIGQ